jgi:hypothetical protein
MASHVMSHNSEFSQIDPIRDSQTKTVLFVRDLQFLVVLLNKQQTDWLSRFPNAIFRHMSVSSNRKPFH